MALIIAILLSLGIISSPEDISDEIIQTNQSIIDSYIIITDTDEF